MSVDLCGYIGPYLTVNEKKCVRHDTIHTCIVSDCVNYKRKLDAIHKYCVECGQKIEHCIIDKEYSVIPYEIVEDKFQTISHYECSAIPEGKMVLISNRKNEWTYMNFKSKSFFTDFTSLNMTAEIIEFQEKYKNEIKEIADVFGPPEFGFGFLNWFS